MPDIFYTHPPLIIQKTMPSNVNRKGIPIEQRPGGSEGSPVEPLGHGLDKKKPPQKCNSVSAPVKKGLAAGESSPVVKSNLAGRKAMPGIDYPPPPAPPPPAPPAEPRTFSPGSRALQERNKKCNSQPARVKKGLAAGESSPVVSSNLAGRKHMPGIVYSEPTALPPPAPPAEPRTFSEGSRKIAERNKKDISHPGAETLAKKAAVLNNSSPVISSNLAGRKHMRGIDYPPPPAPPPPPPPAEPRGLEKKKPTKQCNSQPAIRKVPKSQPVSPSHVAGRKDMPGRPDRPEPPKPEPPKPAAPRALPHHSESWRYSGRTNPTPRLLTFNEFVEQKAPAIPVLHDLEAYLREVRGFRPTHHTVVWLLQPTDLCATVLKYDGQQYALPPRLVARINALPKGQYLCNGPWGDLKNYSTWMARQREDYATYIENQTKET